MSALSRCHRDATFRDSDLKRPGIADLGRRLSRRIELDAGHRTAKDHIGPTRTGTGGTVIGVNVRFQYEDSFDRARVIGVADNARATFEGMPGLRFKFFTLDESARRANNFYVWDSKEAALEFFSDELRQRVTELYGVAPTIEYVEIAQIVDNSGS
jgi:hypothetical protein